MKKRLTTEELDRSHDGLCGASIGDGDCSCLVHWVTALQKELDEKELENGGMRILLEQFRDNLHLLQHKPMSVEECPQPPCQKVMKYIEKRDHKCTCTIDGTPYCKARGTGYCLAENPERLRD